MNSTKLNKRKQDLSKFLLTNGKNMMRNVIERIDKFKQKEITPILIVGESGSGKEFVAQSFATFKKDEIPKDFIAVNCAAYSSEHIQTMLFGYKKGAFTGATYNEEGILEKDYSVVFLDEIDKADMKLQVSLLRYLRTGEIEKLGEKKKVKKNSEKKIIVFGTSANFENIFKLYKTKIYQATLDELGSNKNYKEYRTSLKKKIEKNKKQLSEKTDLLSEQTRFLDDFLNRIASFTILLPPIRQRKEDLGQLVEEFIKKAVKETKSNIKYIDSEVLHFMMMCKWQGNIAELENFIKSGVVFSEKGTIELDGCLEIYAGTFEVSDFLALSNLGDGKKIPFPFYSIEYLGISEHSKYAINLLTNEELFLSSSMPKPKSRSIQEKVKLYNKKNFVPIDQVRQKLENLSYMGLLDKSSDVELLLNHGIKIDKKKIHKYFKLKKEFKNKEDIFPELGFKSIAPFNTWLKHNHLYK